MAKTHAVLWGAEVAGCAALIDFLLQAGPIAPVVETSGATLLVALGPHSALDIWQKALRVRERVPGLTLLRVAAPRMPAEADVLDFHNARIARPDTRLVFGELGGGDDVAA